MYHPAEAGSSASITETLTDDGRPHLNRSAHDAEEEIITREKGGNHLSVHMREKSGEAVQKRRGGESPRSRRKGRRGATPELLSEGVRGSGRGVFFEVGSLATTDYCRHDSKDPSSDAVGSDLNPSPLLRVSPSSCTAPIQKLLLVGRPDD